MTTEQLDQLSINTIRTLSMDAIQQANSGHPEYRWVSGVETTGRPLGRGVATSVGMAMAQKWLAHRYNRPGFGVFDYDIYSVCGDGDIRAGRGALKGSDARAEGA